MSNYYVKEFCTLCEVEHEVEVSTLEENIQVKGCKVSYDRKSYYCPTKETYFMTDALIDENIETALNRYNSMNNSNYLGSGMHLLRYL